MNAHSSEIADIARLVHGRGIFALFKAYMDESGIHGSSPVCVVAGFVAPLACCETFEYGWKEMLRRHRIKYFHSKEFVNLSGIFVDWDAYQKHAFLSDALATISRSMNDDRVTIVGAAIAAKTFFDMSVDQRNWLTGGSRKNNGKWSPNGAPKKPYFLPFQQCVVDAARCPETEGLIHFVFDRQKDFEPSGRRIFSLMSHQQKDISSRLGDIVYTSKERAILLQVADFIAFESWQYLVGKRPRAETDFAQKGTHPLFNRKKVLSMIREEDVARMLSENPIVPGKYFSWPVRVPKATKKRIPMGAKVVSFAGERT